MKTFLIVGRYVVERTFECEAESEEDARAHPERWEELSDEYTDERLSLTVDEMKDEPTPQTGGAA